MSPISEVSTKYMYINIYLLLTESKKIIFLDNFINKQIIWITHVTSVLWKRKLQNHAVDKLKKQRWIASRKHDVKNFNNLNKEQDRKSKRKKKVVVQKEKKRWIRQFD